MSAQDTAEATPSSSLGLVRLAVGLTQGLALFGLHKAWDLKAWPATTPALLWALALVAAFVPLILLGGLGGLRRRTLIAWTVTGAALVGVFAAYDIWRQAAGTAAPMLSPFVVLASAASLFIGHHLIAAADQERRWIAAYPAYFDTAWKDGVQLVLTGLFVGVFWAVLGLGAALFTLIKIDALAKLIVKDWFAFPVTGVVFAAAVQLTDVRIGLIRGIRTVVLALLAWLMPLMALLAVAFLAALPFTGLKPLLATRSATGVLLSAAAMLVVLINAAYQDGDPERRPPAVLRHSGRLAAVALVPIAVIAGYGLMLRIGQYGWTPERIYAAAGVLVAGCYGLGYAIAAVTPGPWVKRLEITNLATAVVILAVFAALFTPIADPARISVADQVGRLQAGRTPPDKFDFKFLRFKAARYGVEALNRLKSKGTGPNAAAISRRAIEALKLTSVWESEPIPTNSVERARALTAYPKGRALPDSFLRQDFSGADPGGCLQGSAKCDAYFADLDGDGADEVLLDPGGSWIWAFKADASGTWTSFGDFQGVDEPIRQALREGRFKTVVSPLRDLEVNNRTLRLQLSDTAAAKLTKTTIILNPH